MRDICPICGSKLSKEVCLNNPPNRGMKCTKCGRVEEIPREEHRYHPHNGWKPGNPVCGREVPV